MLWTKDNSRLTLSAQQQECHLDDLRWMAAPTLKELCGQSDTRLLVFPQSFDEYGDKLSEQRIFDIHGNVIETGNIMGFVGRRNTMIRIQSRFTSDDGRDYFLHYMLQKVFAIHLFDLKHLTDEESIFDFLIYLFPTFLRRAVRHGLYHQYQSHSYNDANVRGRIDVSRHIRNNIPFAGSVAYTAREYASDNHITQLIRHTIEYIAGHPLGGDILFDNDTTKDAVALIREATPTYDKNAQQQIVNANIRPLHHPYYEDYRTLQHLCMQILRHEELKYGCNDNEIFGVLFDGAWLWEEYLNTFLNSVLCHPRNRVGEGRQYIFRSPRGGDCYPDFYNDRMVLDSKYKGYSDGRLQRPDLYQVISYMYIMQLKQGGFIVPVSNETKPRILNGYGGNIGIYGLNIGRKLSRYDEFCSYMKNQEEALLNKIMFCYDNGLNMPCA